MSEESYDIEYRLTLAEAELDYGLKVYGDKIAEKEGYREHRGIDAVHFYLVQKYHWPLNEVRAMKLQDLRFLLTEEMGGWTLPPEANRPMER
jgi:hypothetical protein